MRRTIAVTVMSGVSKGDVFRFSLEQSGEIAIGRDPACQLCLQDPTVSRRHASILLDSDSIWISDNGSSHGTVHMGFQLKPGREEKRRLKSGDEFKIGETIFSVSFETESSFDSLKEGRSGTQSGILSWCVSAKGLLCLVLVLLLFGLLIFAPEEKRVLPRQFSGEVMPLPVKGVKGYWPRASSVSKKWRDVSHLDKAQFLLPTSDLVVEYEVMNEAELRVFVDQALVETIAPHASSWQKRQLVVRDTAVGYERKLVFDNVDYPAAGKSKVIKRWKVKNVRASPISAAKETPFVALLEEAASLSSRVDTTPGALFTIIRALQRAIIELLDETGLDAVDFAVELETLDETPVIDENSNTLDAQLLVSEINKLLEKRKNSSGVVTPNLELKALTAVVAALDAELWRRVNSRTQSALYASKASNYIGAYDNLQAILKMFPEEADYRWVAAKSLMDDDRVVPKRVRHKPSKYR